MKAFFVHLLTPSPHAAHTYMRFDCFFHFFIPAAKSSNSRFLSPYIAFFAFVRPLHCPLLHQFSAFKPLFGLEASVSNNACAKIVIFAVC